MTNFTMTIFIDTKNFSIHQFRLLKTDICQPVFILLSAHDSYSLLNLDLYNLLSLNASRGHFNRILDHLIKRLDVNLALGQLLKFAIDLFCGLWPDNSDIENSVDLLVPVLERSDLIGAEIRVDKVLEKGLDLVASTILSSLIVLIKEVDDCSNFTVSGDLGDFLCFVKSIVKVDVLDDFFGGFLDFLDDLLGLDMCGNLNATSHDTAHQRVRLNSTMLEVRKGNKCATKFG